MKVEEYLAQQGVEFRSSEHPPAYTAQEVAAEEHVSGNLLAKTVVVKADDDFIVCALPASYRLDMSKLARTLNARNVRLADESEMADLFTDVEVGAEPPMGQLWNLPTYVDQHLAKGNEIVFQAGTHSHAIRMKFADYESLTKPRIADLAVRM